ncbi:MAG: hypothetical protein K6G00_04975 [Treponema sp.]|nr:hypothetical protein [Treponema sp.]
MKKFFTIFISVFIMTGISAFSEPMKKSEGLPPVPPPGGHSQKPESYDAVITSDSKKIISRETVLSVGKDENVIHVSDGTTTIKNSVINRNSCNSEGGDTSSFYGVGAAILVTDGSVNVKKSIIETDSDGGAGVFAYGDGVATVSDTSITTRQGASGGIHVAGGGTLVAKNLEITTYGRSSAAIRSDRGSGTMIVDGGTYTSNGEGSPAVYVTADITINNALLKATGSEALCLEGVNNVHMYNSTLSGNMKDDSQNDNTWNVILYQSMSGDSQLGLGTFEMVGGKLIAENGGVFYTTNTESSFILKDVDIQASDDHEYFLRVTGNKNKRGWGRTGENGADCTFTAIKQNMDGDIIWDSISTLTLYMTEDSVLSGSVLDDESCAGSGGNGYCNIVIDKNSSWIVTGDSNLSNLSCSGKVIDAEGNDVSIVGSDGTVYKTGTSKFTVTVDSFSDYADVSGSGVPSSFKARSRVK